jgi:hypothetical protein
MEVKLSLDVTINDKPQPEHNEYVDSYRLGKEAKQIFKANLMRMVMSYAMDHDTGPLDKFVEYLSYSIYANPKPSYSTQAEVDAKDLIRDNFVDEIVQQLLDDGEASDDMNNDYAHGDSTFHETIIDRWYNPKDAIELLNDLSEHEETDSGLWEGSDDYTDILATKAAFTYGNAVYSEWRNLINNINDIDVEEIKWQVADDIATNEKESFTEDEESEIENMDNDEKVAWCEEYYPETFEDNLKEALQKAVEELLY